MARNACWHIPIGQACLVAMFAPQDVTGYGICSEKVTRRLREGIASVHQPQQPKRQSSHDHCVNKTFCSLRWAIDPCVILRVSCYLDSHWIGRRSHQLTSDIWASGQAVQVHHIEFRNTNLLGFIGKRCGTLARKSVFSGASPPRPVHWRRASHAQRKCCAGLCFAYRCCVGVPMYGPRFVFNLQSHGWAGQFHLNLLGKPLRFSSTRATA